MHRSIVFKLSAHQTNCLDLSKIISHLGQKLPNVFKLGKNPGIVYFNVLA